MATVVFTVSHACRAAVRTSFAMMRAQSVLTSKGNDEIGKNANSGGHDRHSHKRDASAGRTSGTVQGGDCRTGER